MLKKVLLNVFYNVAILSLLMCLYWGITKERYSIVLFAVFSIALFVYFKVRLVKELRNQVKK